METAKDKAAEALRPPTGRLIPGGIVFLLGIFCPLFIPLVIASGLSAGIKTVLSGLLALGIPELLMVIAAGILGKPGYQYLKRSLLSLLRRYGPPEKVSRMRYTVGLVMFVVPLSFGWIMPYFMDRVPLYNENRLLINIVSNSMLIASIFVLGGEFWDKLRGLFIWGATVNFPDKKE